MDGDDVMTRPADPPDAVVRYGDHDEAVIDLALPPQTARAHPLLVFLHGGFWRSAHDRVHSRPLTRSLARDGFVVATPEYRRVGGRGPLAGGYPQTLDDVTAALARLPECLADVGLPAATSTTVLGHSAGGHLALWLANETHRLDRVVGLAPVGDLRAAAAAGLGDGAVQAFLGGSPDQVPGAYEHCDPRTRLAARPSCPVVVVHGAADETVPVTLSRDLVTAHPHVVLHELDGVGHFDLIDPLSGAYPTVRDVVAAGRQRR